MWLERLEVQNFRSIASATVVFSSGFNAIFGENGTGKSNMVRAVLKLLGDTQPTAKSFQTSDHFGGDESRDIRIALTLNNGATKRMLSWGSDSSGTAKLLLDGNPLKDPERSKLSPIYLPAHREVSESPGQNAVNPIGRILADLVDLITRDSTVKTAFDAKAAELNGILEGSAVYARFERKMREYSAEHIGSTGDALAIRLSPLDPTKALKTLQVYETHGSTEYNASASGLGVQSGIVIGALRAIAELTGGRYFVVADEPEAYLHPLSQQALRFVLEGLAGAGTQVIVTTHSPHFISARSLEGLHKVSKKDGATRILSYRFDEHLRLMGAAGITDGTREKVEGRLSHHLTVQAREGLFAKSIVLCEGESEAGSLGIWAKVRGKDFPAEGVALVQADGKFSLQVLALFYQSLGIPTYIVFDSDSDSVDNQAQHVRENRKLLRVLSAPDVDFPPTGHYSTYSVFDPDWETVIRASDPDYPVAEAKINAELGLKAGSSKGVRARYVAIEYASTGKTTPGPISSLIESISSFHESAHRPTPAAPT